MNISLIYLFFSIIAFTNQLYFDVFSHRDICFEDTFFEGSANIISYHTFLVFDHNENDKEGFYFFNIFDSENNNSFVNTLLGTNFYQGKVVFNPTTSSRFKICISCNDKAIELYNEELKKYQSTQPKSIKFTIDITNSDTSISLNHDNLADEDFYSILDGKVKTLNSNIELIEKLQENDIDNEEVFSENLKNNYSVLLIITIIQVVLILIVTLLSLFTLNSKIKKIIN